MAWGDFLSNLQGLQDQQAGVVPDENGRYTVSPDSGRDGATTTYARINRAQWNDYKSRFFPHELDVYNSIGNAELTQEQVDRSGNVVGGAFDRSRADAMRNMKAYGTNLNPMQRESFNKKFNRNKKLGVIEARNTTRLAKKERDMNLMAGSSNLAGQSVRSLQDNG